MIIAADNYMLLSAVILVVIAAAIRAEKTAFGSKLTAPAIILLASGALSNAGVIPMQASLYGGIVGYLVPVSIVLLLLKADLIRIVRETGTMAFPFLLCILFAIIGVLLASWLVGIGPDEAKLAGTMAATFVGGSMNFVAVSSALGFENPTIIAAALASDNILGASYLVLLAVVSGTNFFSRHTNANAYVEAEANITSEAPSEMTLQSLSIALAISVTIAAAGMLLASSLSVAAFALLLITVLAVFVANVFKSSLVALRGDTELGIIGMYLFFFSIGASTDFRSLATDALNVGLFTLIILTVHVSLLTVAVRVFRIDAAEAIIASNACIAGPPSAAALAASRGWTHLVTPGLMCGVAGYVVANFIGIALFRWLG